MPRINLLSWRDELREQRRNQFYMSLGAAALGAGLVVLATNMTFNSIIDHQNDRNRMLQRSMRAGVARMTD